MKLSGNFTNKLLLVSLVIFIFGSGYKLGSHNAISTRDTGFSYKVTNTDKNTENIDFTLFWDTWKALEDNYLDKKKLDPKKLYYGAIRGMVASVEDNYTYFLSPDENKQSKDDLNGKFFGIGAELGLVEGQIIIVTPLKASPAEKAGALPGDPIIKVNGESTQNWNLHQAVNKIRGPKGTKVTLTVFRKGEEKNIDIVRDEINVPSVELSYEKDTAILELSTFGDDTNRVWDEKVQEILGKMRSGQVKSLVIDVRGNPGGYLDSAVYIASEFVPQNTLIVKQESADLPSIDYHSRRQGKLLSIPVVVLVNGTSASASEILAGALRDHGRATLVGEKTFGKGTVQQALDLEGGAGVHITIARWVLPKGDWINEKGITPSIEVKNEITEGNTMTRGDDAQLDRALEELQK